MKAFHHKMQNNNLVLVVIATWLILAIYYVSHTPYEHRNHDIAGHLEYSEVIASKGRLPRVDEGIQAYHPPLYYLIVNLIAPKISAGSVEKHANFVRYLSIFFGAITLWIIASLLQKLNKDKYLSLLALLLIASTPKFVFVFSTYNNDSLVTLLAASALAISYFLYKEWASRLGTLLLVVSIAGFYTKYTFVFCALTVCLICSWSLFKTRLQDKNAMRIILVFLLSFVVFLPWLYFHNYAHTDRLVPVNFDWRMHENINLYKYLNTLSTVLKIPILQSSPREWKVPWAYPGLDVAHRFTKRNNYIAFSFVTSVIGEYILKTPQTIFIWFLLLVRLVAYFAAFMIVFRSKVSKLAFSVIFLAHCIHLLFIGFMKPPVWGCSLDYRYVCWTWIAWAVLYVLALEEKTQFAYLLKRIFTLGFIVQVYVVMTLSGESSL